MLNMIPSSRLINRSVQEMTEAITVENDVEREPAADWTGGRLTAVDERQKPADDADGTEDVGTVGEVGDLFGVDDGIETEDAGGRRQSWRRRVRLGVSHGLLRIEWQQQRWFKARYVRWRW